MGQTTDDTGADQDVTSEAPAADDVQEDTAGEQTDEAGSDADEGTTDDEPTATADDDVETDEEPEA